jgi:precorrin-2 methylase
VLEVAVVDFVAVAFVVWGDPMEYSNNIAIYDGEKALY